MCGNGCQAVGDADRSEGTEVGIQEGRPPATCGCAVSNSRIAGDTANGERRPISEYSPREVGIEGERIAASYLVRRGYRVIDRNMRNAGGEADIVAMDEDECVLVEVKTRIAIGEDAESMPELSVDAAKRGRYRQIALLYLVDHPEIGAIRFDVIAINIVAERNARLRHLVAAYSWDD